MFIRNKCNSAVNIYNYSKIPTMQLKPVIRLKSVNYIGLLITGWLSGFPVKVHCNQKTTIIIIFKFIHFFGANKTGSDLQSHSQAVLLLPFKNKYIPLFTDVWEIINFAITVYSYT